MKIFLAVLTVIVMTGCSSAPPKPPEPQGDLTAVNPPHVQINNLYTK